MESVTVGKNIYPDLTDEVIRNVKKVEKLLNIKLDFILDDGIKITYPENKYEPDFCLGSFRLVTSDFKGTAIRIVEDFGYIRFYNSFEEEILTIPILEEI